ncbi:MAG: alpha/beta hydrolase [Butyrivibrio sp.]|nr:alpha/beta hydrolase [Acetatifactor muris]MCM1561620.1 alpha/beta hydrolase [Butyrivibrio sp.]
MLHEIFPIQASGSLPDARLITYIQDYHEEIRIDRRPLVLICPGGAYAYTSEREGEALAMQFLAMGCHAAVLKYSCAPARYPVALTELAAAMALVREHEAEWHVEPEGVIVLGCSAGGHLAASLGTLWQEDFLAEAPGIDRENRKKLRPDGMILCYPVITGGEFAHRGSFENLLGPEEGAEERMTDTDSLLRKLSLETRVTAETPPAFIWHTFTDGSVPVENSLFLVSALRRAGVSTEFHMYPVGGHGLSLADRLTQSWDGGAMQEECTTWISLARTWIESRYVKAGGEL